MAIRFGLQQASTKEGTLGTLVRGLTAAMSKARSLGDAAAGDLSVRLLSPKFSISGRRSAGDGGGGSGAISPTQSTRGAAGIGPVPSAASLMTSVVETNAYVDQSGRRSGLAGGTRVGSQ